MQSNKNVIPYYDYHQKYEMKKIDEDDRLFTYIAILEVKQTC